MISFPRVERLIVSDYALYPGADRECKLDLKLGDGPWLLLGVNGLGKSTLLLMMRFLMTGAVRARGPGFAGERADLQASSSKFFAVRVLDRAERAVAKLHASVGSGEIVIERSLSDLKLLEAKVISGDSIDTYSTEEEYRDAIAGLMGLSRFEDVVRILDQLVFFLEDRQSLIWDQAAQYEIFRALLTPAHSSQLRELEGKIVSADSSARNLNATLYRMSKKRQAEAVKRKNEGDTKARIAAAQGEKDALFATEMKLAERVEKSEEELADASLLVKRAEKRVDDAEQTYEKLKFDVLRQAFAGVSPTAQHIYLKLMSEKFCIACNQSAEEAAKLLQERADTGLCVVCGNPRQEAPNVEDIGDAMKEKARKTFQEIVSLRDELEVLRRQRNEAEETLRSEVSKLSEVRDQADELGSRIRTLRKKLPVEEGRELSREEERIIGLREQVQIFRDERDEAESQIDELLQKLKFKTESIREKLEAAFDSHAEPFFAEQVRLVYSPRNAKIGQGGRVFEFPAFEVEMTSGATESEFVRRTADQVSLSQREYLDIIFRMALIDEFGEGAGTLAVDGPEGSLDAVFAELAGNLFSSFAGQPNVNVVLACNVIEGGFIPHSLSAYGAEQRWNRIVNLIDIARPTQALNKLHDQYDDKLASIIERNVA